MELYTKTALELSSMIQKKECSCEEILSSVLSRISDCDDKLGAYITVSDKAHEQARKT
ncbi:MAG: Asp-tRNA(Asn)/Glu-tRNA(Gln) amidotransferase subunit GatA, partial [Ruminococcus sp.]|nr:Asp-tRNA(Asn)/Glu-tRNA(Gln) amidotransferase subunit GatA [Ruminococcus sp.]